MNKNFSKITGLVGSVVHDLSEQVQSPRARRALSSALDLVRPHFVSLGVRISVLSSSQIELLLPRKKRNLDEHGQILMGVQISAAIEAYKLLWKRNAPDGEFQVTIRGVQARILRPTQSAIKIRGELSEVAREARWAELAKSKKSRHEITLHLFDDQEQICGEVDIQSDLSLQEFLEWK